VVFRKDEYLKERWGCSDSKLWRMRRDDILHSIKLIDGGPWITSDEEIQRIESRPPVKGKPRGIAAKHLDEGRAA
jgi:hypothetical protein